MLSCEVLTLLLSELVNMTRDSGRGFATYISDVIARCKLQKTILHCLLASVYDAREQTSGGRRQHITEAIVHFNERSASMLVNNNMQIKLLSLVRMIIVLEEQIRSTRGDAEDALPHGWGARLTPNSPHSLKYIPGRPMAQQSMFLNAVMSALKQQHQCQMHQHVVAMVTSALPYLGRALGNILVCVVLQLCRNLDLLASFYSGQTNR